MSKLNNNLTAIWLTQFSELQLIKGIRLFCENAVKQFEYDEEQKKITAIVDDNHLFNSSLTLSYAGNEEKLEPIGLESNENDVAANIVAIILEIDTEFSQVTPLQEKKVDLSEGSWLAFIDANKFEVPCYYPNMARHRIIYVIDQERESQRYRVSIRKSYLTKTNKYTKIEPLSIDVIRQEPLPKFVSPEDRQLLFTMLDAEATGTDENESIFYLDGQLELPKGKELFKQLLKTGRSFWQTTESSPLIYKEQDSSHLNNPWFRITKVFADFYLNMDTGHCGPIVEASDFDEYENEYDDSLQPKPCLKFSNKRIDTPWLDTLLVDVNFADISIDYDGLKVYPENIDTYVQHKTSGRYFKRDLVQEFHYLSQLKDFTPIDYVKDGAISSFFRESHFAVKKENEWLSFMRKNFPQMRKNGWRIQIDRSFGLLVQRVDEWYGVVNEEAAGWFDISIGVVINGERVNVLPLIVEQLKLLQNNDALKHLNDLHDDELFVVTRKEGERVGLPVKRIKPILNTLVELLGDAPLNQSGDLSFSRHQLTQLHILEQSFETEIAWQGSYDWRSRVDKLSNFKSLENVSLTNSFNATLRDYQQEGLNWLQFLIDFDLGGVLADDMGLGKTVQTLAHLHTESQKPETQLPSIVVAPTSLMANWKREAENFAPSLKVCVLHGINRKEYFDKINDFDLILTTYPLLIRDAEILLNCRFHLAILDEAQVIKNSRSKMTKTACALQSNYRLCLTGTPVENHLGELWSLFNFLMPGFLGEEEQFARLFRTPIEKQGDEQRQQILAKRVNPFILRRTKDAVVSELPPKTVIEEYIELDDEQSTLYESIRIAMHQRIQKAIANNGIGKSNLVIGDALLKLRQVCCAPSLVKLESAKDIESSAKLDWLRTTIPNMVEEGRRILLFSQFTEMLKLIEEEMNLLNIPYLKLTGSTRDRETPVNRFQQQEVPLFLISLKAGGTGLNLTAADTVIHYDPWWNPAAENQASDRAYRIGQDKPVFVYKLLCKNTVEEKIQAMQERKKALAEGIFGKSGQGSSLTQNDLDDLFASFNEV